MSTTAAPWRTTIHPETGEWMIEAPEGDVVCVVPETRWEACGGTVRTQRTSEGGGFLVANCTPNTGRAFADAELIAAAPELLATCRAVKDLLVNDLEEPGRTVFWQAVAAIAKAEGRVVLTRHLP